MSLSIQPKMITPDAQLNLFAASTPIFRQLVEVTPLIKEIATIVAVFLLEGNLVDWYVSLKLLNRLPKAIPMAPEGTPQFFERACPKVICAKVKPDGSAYTMEETCTLSLVARDYGTFNEMDDVLKAYGKPLYPKEDNPLQVYCWWNKAKEKYGNAEPGQTHWIVQTNTMLEGSQGKTEEVQTPLVEALANETSEPWIVPRLRGTFVTIFQTLIAKKVRRYANLNDKNSSFVDSKLISYTRVQERIGKTPLMVGGLDHLGLNVLGLESYSFLVSYGMGAQLDLTST